MKSNLKMPDYWTPEQATIVFEFIDEMREAILQQYELHIIEQLKSERLYETDIDMDDNDLPF